MNFVYGKFVETAVNLISTLPVGSCTTTLLCPKSFRQENIHGNIRVVLLLSSVKSFRYDINM